METKINDLVQPGSWDEYIGQTDLKTHLDLKIRAALAQERMLDHMLIVAHPGAGKSTLVKQIAKRIDDLLLVLPMPMPLNDFLYALEGFFGGIVFLDELHNAPDSFQEALQHGLYDGYIQGKYGERVPTKRFTFIGATTTELSKELLPALVGRFPYRPAFEPYTDAEMTEIMIGMARRAGTSIDPKVCAELAGATGGVPRQAEALVASARDLAALDMEVTADAVLSLTGVDADGLTKNHLDYLAMLNSVGGVAGLSLMKSMLGMNGQTVEDLERTLVMRGLIRRAPNGRKLMAKGRAKIDQNGPGNVGDVVARRRNPAA